MPLTEPDMQVSSIRLFKRSSRTWTTIRVQVHIDLGPGHRMIMHESPKAFQSAEPLLTHAAHPLRHDVECFTGKGAHAATVAALSVVPLVAKEFRLKYRPPLPQRHHVPYPLHPCLDVLELLPELLRTRPAAKFIV